MILYTLSTVLLVATAQTGAADQGLSDVHVLRRMHEHHTRMAETAEVVRAKTTNAAVRTFATALANEHRRLDASLVSIAKSARISLEKGAISKEDAIDTTGYGNALTKMKTMRADKAYDAAFLDLIAEDHNQMLHMIQTEKKRTGNARLKAHLEEIYTLELKHRNRAMELAGKKAAAAS